MEFHIYMLLTPVIMMKLLTEGTASTLGTTFVIGFIEPYRTSGKFFLSITSRQSANVTISSVGFNISERLHIPAVTSVQYDLGNDTFYDGDMEVTDQTIVINSDKDISVYCFSDDEQGSAGYTAIPVDKLDIEYLGVSYVQIRDESSSYPVSGEASSALLIIATVDSTEVKIKISQTSDGKCGELHHGNSKTFTLSEKYQVVGIRCQSDLTGTLIKSKHPVAVVSGNTRTSVPHGSPVYDHLLTMVPPVSTYGKSFVLHDLPLGSDGTIYRIIAPEDGTDIMLSSGAETKVDKQEFYELDTGDTGPVCLTSGKPVLVVMFAKGGTSGPFMSIIPPTNRFMSSYVFNTSMITSIPFATYMTLVVPIDNALGVLPKVTEQFRVIQKCCFATVSVLVQDVMVDIYHNESVPFGVTIHGFRRDPEQGYGMPAGYDLTSGEEPCDGGNGCGQEFGPECVCSGDTPMYECSDNSMGCTAFPCANNGTCSSKKLSYMCQCQPGFEGLHCSTDVNECSNQPCQNGGNCTDEIDSYNCACPSGFNGTSCETEIDECESNPCLNDGTCTDGRNQYTCTCFEGFTAVNCETDIDECESEPCQNGGSCMDEINSHNCTCPPGFTGIDCETEIDECKSDPCVNGGTCTDAVNQYSCNCLSGYTDTNCDTDVNECNSDPCQNGGSCIEDINYYNCNCPLGFAGTNCEKDVNECHSEPCENGGTCLDEINIYNCKCQPGFTGINCETELPCECVNGGTCEWTGDGSTICVCPPGFTGTFCDTDDQVCSPETCKNGGTCVPTQTGFKCICPPTFTGFRCELIERCVCLCKEDVGRLYNSAIVNEISLQWKVNLTLETKTLSKTIRKHISIEDKRPSATAIGSVGVVIIIVVVTTIALLDIDLLIYAVKGNR